MTASEHGWPLADLERLLLPLSTQSVAQVQSGATARLWLEPVVVSDARLSPLILDALKEEPRSKGRRFQTFRLVMLCLEHGLVDAETLDIALRHAPTLSKWQAEDGSVDGIGRVAAEVQRIYSKHTHTGLRCSDVNCPNEGARDAEQAPLRTVLARLRAAPWKGHSRNLRDAVVVVVDKALAEGRVWTAISERQWAHAAGMSPNTVRKYKQQLLDAGALTPRTPPGSRLRFHSDAFTVHAAEIEALIPQREGGVGGTSAAPLQRGVSAATSAVDDLRRAGVTADGGLGWGKTATDIYLLLCSGKHTTAEIALALGSSQRTVREHLRGRLSSVVIQHGERWTVVADPDVAAFAEQRGVLHRARAQQAKFKRQSRDFREHGDSDQDAWILRATEAARRAAALRNLDEPKAHKSSPRR